MAGYSSTVVGGMIGDTARIATCGGRAGRLINWGSTSGREGKL